MKDNYRTDLITFDVASIDLPYNVIITKFMAVLHYTYLAINKSRPKRVI
jgi:hypothetical protein